MGQPRRNEKRFYRYPLHRIVAILDDAPGLGYALADMGAAGIDVSKVNVLSGPRGPCCSTIPASGMDCAAGSFAGARGMATRPMPSRSTPALCLDGRHVVYVPVDDDQERQRTIDILRARGGHHLLHFRRWTIEEIRRPHDHHGEHDG